MASLSSLLVNLIYLSSLGVILGQSYYKNKQIKITDKTIILSSEDSRRYLPNDIPIGIRMPSGNVYVAENQNHAKNKLQALGLKSDSADRGWMYQYSYTGTGCGGENMYFSNGVVTNVCLNSKRNDTGEILSSYLFTCHGAYAQLDEYFGGDCESSNLEEEQRVPLNCVNNNTQALNSASNTTDDDDSTGPPTYSYEVFCQTSSSLLELQGDFYLQKFYQYDDCQEAVSYTGKKNRQCFYYEKHYSVFLSYPYYYVFDNEDCSDDPTSVGDLDTDQCTMSAYYAYNDGGNSFAEPYYSYTLGSYVDATNATFAPTRYPTLAPSTSRPTHTPTTTRPTVSFAPSLAPTTAPTALPTLDPTNSIQPSSFSPSSAKPNTLSPNGLATREPTLRPSRMPTTSAVKVSVDFNVTQGYSGITQTSYNEDKSVNDAVISSTVASFLTGVKAADVRILSVATPAAVTNRRKLQTASLDVQYTVTLNDAYSAGYSSAETAYDGMKSDLDTAIESGDFTDQLTSSASAVGATLSSATALAATYSNYTSTVTTFDDDNNDNDDSDEGLSDGAIAGIVIGTVAGLALIAVAVYYAMHHRKGRGSFSSDANVTTSGTDATTAVKMNPVHGTPIDEIDGNEHAETISPFQHKEV